MKQNGEFAYNSNALSVSKVSILVEVRKEWMSVNSWSVHLTNCQGFSSPRGKSGWHRTCNRGKLDEIRPAENVTNPKVEGYEAGAGPGPMDGKPEGATAKKIRV